MAKSSDIFRKRIFEHNGYKIDTTKGVSRFPILDEDDNEVAGIRLNNVQYINGENIKTHYKARLAIYDVEGKEVYTPEQNRNILEIFSKFTITHGIEPTEIVHRKDNEDQWRGNRPSYHYNKKTIGVPKNIEGEFLFITTSPEKIPSIVSKSQREQLIEHGIEIYGVPVSFLPYSTDSSINDKILLQNISGQESHLIINNKDDLKNSTFIHDMKYTKEGNEIRVLDVYINIDNKSNEPVEMHGIDGISTINLHLKYDSKNKDNYFDFSDVKKVGFKILNTSHIYKIHKEMDKHPDKVESKKKRFGKLENWGGYSITDKEGYEKLKEEFEKNYKKAIREPEKNLYKTINTFEQRLINNKLYINYNKTPRENETAKNIKTINNFVPAYMKEHEDELKDEPVKDFVTSSIHLHGES